MTTVADVVMRLLVRAAYAWACAIDDHLVGPVLEQLIRPTQTPDGTSAAGSATSEGKA